MSTPAALLSGAAFSGLAMFVLVISASPSCPVLSLAVLDARVGCTVDKRSPGIYCYRKFKDYKAAEESMLCYVILVNASLLLDRS